MPNAFVRDNGAFSGTSATITAAASGNTLVLFFVNQRNGAARTISSISTTNVTWVKLAGLQSGTCDVEIWYGTVAGGTSGTAVTLTMSGTGANGAGNILEFSGVLTSGTINDGTGVTNNNTSTSPTTGGFTANEGNDLLLACEGHLNGTTPSATPGGSWSNGTFANNSTTCGVRGAYQAIGTAGSKSASWTIGNVAWVTCIGALKVSPQTKSLTSGAATMAGGIAKSPNHLFASSMQAMDAGISRSASHVIASSMQPMDGVIVRGRLLSASMALMSGAVMRGRAITAASATMTAVLSRSTKKVVTPQNNQSIRTLLGTNSSASPGTSWTALTAVPLNDGDTLFVVVGAGPNTTGFVTAVSWNGIAMNLDLSQNTQGSPAANLGIFRLGVQFGGSGDIVVTTTNASLTVVLIASSFSAFFLPTITNQSAGNSSFGAATSLATSAGTTNRALQVLVGALITQGSSSNNPGTWQNSWSPGARIGTSSGTLVTIQEGYKILDAVDTNAQASVSGFTSSVAGIAYESCWALPQGAMSRFPGSISRQAIKAISAVSASWDVVFDAAKTGGGHLYTQALDAATATWDAILTKLTGKPLSASSATNSASITKRTGKKLDAS